MLKIQSGDNEVKSLVVKLVQALEGAGVYFNPALQLNVKGAQLSFSSRKKLVQKDKLISLPLRCMPLLDDFRWFIDKDRRLCCELRDTSKDKANIDLHVAIVGALLKLYNRLRKVDDIVRTSPIIQLLEQRQLLDTLLEFSHKTSLRQQLDGDLDDLIVQTFWNGRTFGDYLTGEIHLIPVMEFFDHSIFAGGFYWSGFAGERNLVSAYQPSKDMKGLFARYELMDNLHAFMMYGFVDDDAFFVQSQPFSLSLNDKILIEVGYQSASKNQSVAEDWLVQPTYSNSLMYRSRITLQEDRVFVPYMLIPPKQHIPAFDEALLAQLKEIEQHFNLSKGLIANSAAMQAIKRAMLEKNKLAYRAIATAAKQAQLDAGAPVTRMLKKMLSNQMSIIEGFAKTLT